ncbi:MAG: hypothetical protein WBV82_21385, partial [Myxococcaceae bacterium]
MPGGSTPRRAESARGDGGITPNPREERQAPPGDASARGWSGLSGWQNLNPTLSDNVESLHIANVDGLPGDDILRYVATSD